MNELSLLKFCIPCNSKCCKAGKLIGTPILSADEAKKMPYPEKTHLQEVISPVGEKYFVIKERKKSNKCFFLNDDNTCRIQNNKPLDCLCYPIKAVYSDDKIWYILDSECPACTSLSKDFIKNAKKIALKSIKRFDKQTYSHWLENYIGWVKKNLSNMI
ncbi:MAG: hypothetical protein V1659_02405 [Candidatus Woesearchaeota archaeon]